MSGIMSSLLHLFIICLTAPLLLGIINRTKAWFAGRNGQPLLQTYFDLWKLFQKQLVLSRTTSWLFVLGPLVNFAVVLCAALFVPIGFNAAPLSFTGDLILFIYLMALGRFFTANAAMDTGSAFEGMGAVREVSYASLVEPTICVVFIALAKITGALSLTPMLLTPLTGLQLSSLAALLLLALGWFVVVLVEGCRVPFDDPNTHLELTMVHEVMVLDHSGPLFALITWAGSIKLFLTTSVFVSILIPKLSTSPDFGWPQYILAMLLSTVLVGVVESTACRLRLPAIPKFLLGAFLLSAAGMIILINSTLAVNIPGLK